MSSFRWTASQRALIAAMALAQFGSPCFAAAEGAPGSFEIAQTFRPPPDPNAEGDGRRRDEGGKRGDNTEGREGRGGRGRGDRPPPQAAPAPSQPPAARAAPPADTSRSPQVINRSPPPAAAPPQPAPTAAPRQERRRFPDRTAPAEATAPPPAAAAPQPAPTASPRQERRRFPDRTAPTEAVAPPAVRRERPPETARDNRGDRDDGRRARVDRERGDYRRFRDDRDRAGPRTIEAARAVRRSREEKGRTIIEEADRRMIIRGGGRPIIVRDDAQRFRRFDRDASVRRRPDGRNVMAIRGRNGVTVYNVTGPDGRLIRRYRRGPDGRIVNLIDNRRTWHRWQRAIAGGAAAGLIVNLGPPIFRGPRERYILDYGRASYDDIYDLLSAGPIDDDVRGRYTLDEVISTYNLRERMRRIDLDINFAFGSWEIPDSEIDKLELMADAMKRLIDDHPDEVFLIEGHTDAVGDDVDNLALSDRRAEEVATLLSEEFSIPPENLTTQGYGEEFLKIDTDGPERRNRRVSVRRVSPLLDRTARRDEEDDDDDRGPPGRRDDRDDDRGGYRDYR